MKTEQRLTFLVVMIIKEQ